MTALLIAALVTADGTPVTANPTGDTDVEAASEVDPSPTQWPNNALITARLQGAANALRLSGPDRYQTSLALSLGLRGAGGFPYATPDPSSGGAADLAAANGWWGLETCPRSVIIVAGDVAADALAASALSDPTGESTEPFLERTAAADPLFDPIGGFARVDTDAAPILVTRSTRQGATALSPATRLAAQDLRAGGCTTARQAIVVGGTAAVPDTVDAELVSIGFDEVFRVAGSNRYDTAAMIARSLGTAAVPAGATTCAQPDALADSVPLAFHANSVVEYRPDARSCELLGRTVVLADGVTGADALAAGWWTSLWQVPVLLHDGSARLTQPTAETLATLGINHVIVLGGTSRISAAVATQAAALAGDARIIRVAGADRSATSVAMAERFGGWFTNADGDTPVGPRFAGSMVCLAASSGEGATAQGWPDALSAGPWCGRANGVAANPLAPVRALGPINGVSPRTTAGGPPRPAHDAVPILLVPFGATSLPRPVADLLTGAFSTNTTWCTSNALPDGCIMPGFGVLLGGTTALSAAVMQEVSSVVSGRSATEAAMTPPTFTSPFVTELDMAPVYAVSGTGGRTSCSARGSMTRARWLSVFDQSDRAIASVDVFTTNRYRADADGVARSPGVLAPTCVRFASSTPVRVRAVGLAGWRSGSAEFALTVMRRMSMTESLSSAAPAVADGLPITDTTTAGGVTSRVFTTAGGSTINAGAASATVSASTVSFTLTRGTPAATAPTVVSGEVSATTALGTITGVFAGEAVFVEGAWQIRGRFTTTGGTWATPAGSGGFQATLTDADGFTWRADVTG